MADFVPNRISEKLRNPSLTAPPGYLPHQKSHESPA
jgi:hypothetical protein